MWLQKSLLPFLQQNFNQWRCKWAIRECISKYFPNCHGYSISSYVLKPANQRHKDINIIFQNDCFFRLSMLWGWIVLRPNQEAVTWSFSLYKSSHNQIKSWTFAHGISPTKPPQPHPSPSPKEKEEYSTANMITTCTLYMWNNITQSIMLRKEEYWKSPMGRPKLLIALLILNTSTPKFTRRCAPCEYGKNDRLTAKPAQLPTTTGTFLMIFPTVMRSRITWADVFSGLTISRRGITWAGLFTKKPCYRVYTKGITNCLTQRRVLLE